MTTRRPRGASAASAAAVVTPPDGVVDHFGAAAPSQLSNLIGDILRVDVGCDELLQNRCRRGVVARRCPVDADDPGAAGAGDLSYRAADPAGHPEHRDGLVLVQLRCLDRAEPADDEVHPDGGGFINLSRSGLYEPPPRRARHATRRAIRPG